MYIKQIIIQGFKSYKDQTVIEPFSPGTNVIVGRNGSGKSNFFAAIRFVLSDAYTQMTREERQALLHEGSGSAVMSAYVEIIFDNSDERFPTGNKEVILRRTIGLKKDDYSVDRKVVSKTDVTNLLEAAGFSRSNPYYIVPQGRVTALTNMKESDRLNLLKEVAGTQVYEARRTESLKIMSETNNKREKIDELLDYIKERLSELEEEKEELRGYQDKDRERRCLEYAFYHQEQVKIQDRLDEIDGHRQEGQESADTNRAQFANGEKRIAKLKAEKHKLEKEVELLQIDHRQSEEDHRANSRAKAKVELKVKALKDGQSSEEQARAQHAEDLARVKAEVAAKESELATIIPDFEKRKKKASQLKQELDTAEGMRNRLYEKQTRSSQYKSKAERDAFLTSEIQNLNLAIGPQKAIRMEADEQAKKVSSSIMQLEKDVLQLRERLEGWGGNLADLADKVSRATEVLDKIDDEKKVLQREEEKLHAKLREAGSERDTAERNLSGAMDGAVSRGLASIRRLKREQDIPGAYGTLSELLEVSEAYRLPTELIAGNSLFHYVVDNAETATHLSKMLFKNKSGRVTFMPIAQLDPRPIKMPRANDAVPLLSKIRFDEKYRKAFEQVFGKAVVCPNLAVAGQYARSHGVDGITPDGDTTTNRGAMTGGYIDPRKSRLEFVKALNAARDEHDQLQAQLETTKQKINAKRQEGTQAASELQMAKHNLQRVNSSLDPLKEELREKSGHLEREKRRLEKVLEGRENADKTITEYGEALEALETELGTDFKKVLTAAEERQLEEISKRIPELHKKWGLLNKQRMELGNRKSSLETELNQNLRLKLDELNSQAFENAASSGTAGGLKEAQRELKKVQNAVAAVEASLRETEDRLDSLGSRIEKLEAERLELEKQQQDIATLIERQQQKMERALQRKDLLVSNAADCAKNIRDLGVLPEEAFDKYERMESKTITAKLKKVNDALKKYKHVNKKAFEQYNSFTNQQDQLLKRRKELDASQESIEGLVQHLDQRKDEAIERTFKQVSKEFATIFEKLVPAGQGRLVIQRKTDRRGEPEDSDEEEQRRSVENYTGVGISVSFNSKMFDEQQKIQQLSGGQKSLCALCLIFALQQTESSPMVIFDEVDANLDAQYRTAVAGLLESISRDAGTQFICTTFRPEIVLIADKCYGVTFRNKTSSIDCVPTEDALSFVEGQKS